MLVLDNEGVGVAPCVVNGSAPIVPSFPLWIAAQNDAEGLIQGMATDPEIYAAMQRTQELEARVIVEIRQAGSAQVDPAQPYLFYHEGRTYVVLPDGAEIEVAGRLSSRLLAIDPGRRVVGSREPVKRPRATGKR